MYVCCAESEFAGATFHIYPAGILLYLISDRILCAIGRCIVNHENIESIGQCKHRVDDI